MPAANFNLIARPYRFLEYLALGPLLQRTRTQFVSLLHDRREALLLGDGDGRFLAALLAINRSVSVHAVDTSEVMLSLLRRRAAAWTEDKDGDELGRALGLSCRVCTHHQSALAYSPDVAPDLVVTHFLFDCLRQPEVDGLVRRLTGKMAPGGIWLVSEFRIPPGRLRAPAWLYIRMLYFAFRIVTGLRTTRLPDYASVFADAGLTRIACHRRLFGILTSEVWQKDM